MTQASAPPGIFDLRTPADVLQKMARELERLRDDPDNVDHAFNFFVTAEHMLDWLFPGNEHKSTRQVERASTPLLALVSHIASDSKHFDQLAPHHASVKGYERTGAWFSNNWFPEGYFARAYFAEGGLMIALSDEAAREIGDRISAVSLAERVYEHWSKRLEVSAAVSGSKRSGWGE